MPWNIYSLGDPETKFIVIFACDVSYCEETNMTLRPDIMSVSAVKRKKNVSRRRVSRCVARQTYFRPHRRVTADTCSRLTLRTP